MNLKVLLPGILFCAFALSSNAQVDGEALFKANCKSCHSLDMRLVGPALKGVNERRSEEWLISFIKSSTSMIESGDSTSVALYSEYNEVLMPDQQLNDQEIRGILAYIETGGKPAAASPIARPVVDRGPKYEPLSFTSYIFWIPYTVSVLAIVGLLYYMAEATSLSGKSEGESPSAA